MRVHTLLQYEWNGAEYVLIHEEGFDYSGPVALCKGDNTARAMEQQQAAFNSQLMGIFSQNFAKQTAIFEFIKGKMEPLMENPTGFSKEALAAMRTSANDNISNSYQNAQRALQAKQFSQGGRELPSGVNAQLDSALMQAQASDKASTQNNITLQDENLKQQNYWNALNALNGQQSVLNPLGYAGAATAGSNAVANLSQAVTASSQSGLMGMVGSIAGGALSGAGKAAAGGATGGLSGLFGCWVAAAVFNEDFHTGIKTNMVRNWLWNVWGKHSYAKPVLWLYQHTGQWVAKQPLFVKALTPLFELALRKAQR